MFRFMTRRQFVYESATAAAMITVPRLASSRMLGSNAEMHERYVKYLGDIGVDPATSTLGPWLECDAEHECIKDNPKADEFVKGFYRMPFVVPEIEI